MYVARIDVEKKVSGDEELQRNQASGERGF